jgi:NAD(P)-dependent dehydrogenase (short-subunit alcohol dehydrogenase family)
MGRLDDKVAIVTGAGSGIGRATAVKFAAEGARVVAMGRTEATLVETREVARESGGEVIVVAADAGSEEGADAALRAACDSFGGLDVLINNAGVGWAYDDVRPGSMAPLAETPVELWHDVMRINLDSVYHMCHRAIPEMRKRGGGAIVNVASTGGLRGMADAHTYSAAKAGMVNLTRSLARTYGCENIRTNCLAPGLTDTGMVAMRMALATEQGLQQSIPLGRAGTPEEMASAILFLVADATYCNGAILVADGGSSA